MRLSHTTGLELPTPGTAIFQTTFVLASKVTGTSLSSALPVPLGPKKRSQWPAEAAAGTARAASRSSVRSILGMSHFLGGKANTAGRIRVIIVDREGRSSASRQFVE